MALLSPVRELAGYVPLLRDEFVHLAGFVVRTLLHAPTRASAVPPARLRAEGGPARPVMLVHGLYSGPAVFDELRTELTDAGFGPVVAHGYGPAVSDVRAEAVRLGARIERLRRESGATTVSVVGHSLGGLIARYHVQRLGGDTHVDRLVTVGTPHRGTRTARLLAGHPLAAQLRPRGPLVAELAEPAPACRTRITAYYSDADLIIRPVRAAMVDHPDLDTENVVVRGVGHLSMLHHRPLLRLVCATLAAAQDSGTTNVHRARGRQLRRTGSSSSARVPIASR